VRPFLFLILSFCVIATVASSPICYARGISFSWTAGTEEIDGYKLYVLVGSAGGITKDNATEIRVLDQTTSYTCQGLDDNQTYHFALTAFRNIDNLESNFSGEITLPPNRPPIFLQTIYKLLLLDHR